MFKELMLSQTIFASLLFGAWTAVSLLTYVLGG